MTSKRRKTTRAAGQQNNEQLFQQTTEILRRHARLTGTGGFMLCAPSKVEQKSPEAHWRWQGNDEKVILLDRQHAEDCARELAALYGEPRRAYRCPRSRRGHYHVTSSQEPPA